MMAGGFDGDCAHYEPDSTARSSRKRADELGAR